jgi:hypothetical protein
MRLVGARHRAVEVLVQVGSAQTIVCGGYFDLGGPGLGFIDLLNAQVLAAMQLSRDHRFILGEHGGRSRLCDATGASGPTLLWGRR